MCSSGQSGDTGRTVGSHAQPVRSPSRAEGGSEVGTNRRASATRPLGRVFRVGARLQGTMVQHRTAYAVGASGTDARVSDREAWSVLLAQAWPAVAARLERSLSRRGVDRVAREDIVQDVAVRALARRVPFGSAEDLVGWALTVGHNLWTDDGRRWHRRGGASIPLLEPDDQDEGLVGIAPASDPAVLVEERWAVDAIVDAL